MKVYFIGAGPGDPELISLKGKRLIQEAPVIIYTGSLVNPAVLDGRRPDARVYDSASLNLDEICAIYRGARNEDLDVARVHTGDPSLYGAIGEQIARLKAEGIPFEIVPGISSFCAAAAALRQELTAPGISQTVILTRLAGRTPVPEKEDLASLAGHQATLVLFLSVNRAEELSRKLLRGGYGGQTPAAVVSKASWPDERVIRTTIKDLPRRVAETGLKKTALVIVGEALGEISERSLLYHEAFSHGFREATANDDE